MIEDEMLRAVDEMVRRGRPPKYKTAIELWERFLEYKAVIDRNPWRTMTTKAKKQKQGGTTQNPTNSSREAVEGERLIRKPYTKRGWALFAGIGNWEQFKRDNIHKKDFRIIIRAIDSIIEDNQISGAIIGEFNERIVSRLNALEEIQVVKGDRLDSLSREELLAEAERLRKTRED